MTTHPASIRAFIAGNSGSGKTTRAWTLYLQRFPRRIIIDHTGEWSGKVDKEVATNEELVDAIQELSPRGRWTISASIDESEMPELINWLIPVPHLDKSPVLTLGGVVLMVDEVDLIAPQGPPSREIRNLYRRSRHVGLSVVSATQRPANVSREVSAQSNQIVAHFLSEPRDRNYMADVMRWDKHQVMQWLSWVKRHRHGAVWKEVQTGKVLWLPDSGPPLTHPPGSQAVLKLSDADDAGESA